MEKIKIVKIMGGLGNQMFEYAFGQVLKRQQHCEVYYDTSWFDEINKTKIPATNLNIDGVTLRDYELSLFKNLNIKVADEKLLRKYQDDKIEEIKLFQFDKNLLNSKKVYFDGYFQCANYYKDIKENLINDFKFPQIMDDDKFNQNWINVIKNCKNSVFIHVRRGDYLGNNDAENCNVIAADYYKKAVRYIAKRIENPTFFIFGENCEEFVNKNLNLKYPHYYIGNNNSENNENWKDIVLMMQCKHAIIANSSFSWWAAYLSDYKGKITIAPVPWLNRGDGIICKNWIKFNRIPKRKSLNPFNLLLKNIKYLTKINLKEMNSDLANLKISINDINQNSDVKAKFMQLPVIKDGMETLEELVRTDKSIIRFGDGEFSIMQGNDIPFQSYSLSLSKALQHIFYEEDEKLLTGAMYDYFHPFNSDYYDFVRDFYVDWLMTCYNVNKKYFNFKKVYYSTTISQVFPTYKRYDFEKHFSLFRSIWKDKNVVLITGDRVLNNIKYNILDNCLNLKTILAPTIDAFKEYHKILNDILKQTSKDELLLFALGPAGKVLAYDLYKRGYRVIDIGHAIKDYDCYKTNVEMSTNEIINFFKPD